MQPPAGKRLAMILALSSLLVSAAAAILGRSWIIEKWYLYKLESPDSDGDETTLAMNKLAEMKSAAAVPFLVKMIATHLGDLEPQLYFEYRKKSPEIQAILTTGKGAVPPLLKILKDGKAEKKIRRWAARLLGLLGQDAVPALQEASRHGDPQVRSYSLYASHHLEPAEQIQFLPQLLERFHDEIDEVRRYAVQSSQLFRYKSEEQIIPHLLEALKDPYEPVREQAINLLNADRFSDELESGDSQPAAISALAEAVKDQSARVHFTAIKILKKLGLKASAAAPALLETLLDDGADESLVNDLSLCLKAISPPGRRLPLPSLAKGLGKKRVIVRRTAAWLLANLGPKLDRLKSAEEAFKALSTALKDDDNYVREMSAKATGYFNPRTKEALPLPTASQDDLMESAGKQAEKTLAPQNKAKDPEQE